MSVETGSNHGPDSRSPLSGVSALLRQGRYEDALSHFNSLLRPAQPPLGDGTLEMAQLLIEYDCLEDAETALLNALSTGESPQILMELGGLQRRLGKLRSSEQILQELARNREPDARVLRSLGLTLVASGQLDSARATLGRALKFFPHSPELLTDAASLEHFASVSPRALELLQVALLQDPAYTPAIAWKTIVLTELREDDDASILLDAGNLIKCIHLDELGLGLSTSFLDEIVAYSESHETLGPPMRNESIYGGQKTRGLLNDECAVVAELQQLIAEAFGSYVSATRFPRGHPLGSVPETAATTYAWATVLERGGSIGPHYHPKSVLSGVLHTSSANSRTGGETFFGRVPAECDHPQRVMAHKVSPMEGTVVIFPSYFFHEVSEVLRPDSRTSIAFDLRRVR